ncbi:MAG TPA: hypothetical protein VIL95_00825 [Bacillota bacterium]
MRRATLIRLPDPLYEAVRERAFRERRSMNAVLVEAVERYIEANSGPEAPQSERPDPVRQFLDTLRRLPRQKAYAELMASDRAFLATLAVEVGILPGLRQRKGTLARAILERLHPIDGEVR